MVQSIAQAALESREKPIADFRLVVDKGDPRKLVSFCGDRVKPAGPLSSRFASATLRRTAVSMC